MDPKLPNLLASNLMTTQISQPDKRCGGKSNLLFSVHILLRSITVPPSTEPEAAAPEIVRVIKEYLNEMPYWKNHWEPPTVNQELADCIYDELAVKNWDLSPQYLWATVDLMGAMTEVKYIFTHSFCLLNPVSSCT